MPSYRNRRQFLRAIGAGALLLPAGASLLAACGDDDDADADGEDLPVGLVNGTPDHPAELPLNGRAVGDGLSPEKGPLKVYIWDNYLNADTIAAFESAYGTTVELTTFTTTAEAIGKLRSGKVRFDVYVPTFDYVGRLVSAGLIQPLNRSYIPNLANVWPVLASPFYDVGSHYTVPYTAYTIGVGYRADRVQASAFERPNPYDIFVDPAHKGDVWVYDDYRDGISLALLHEGVTDLNTTDPAALDKAAAFLRRLTEEMAVRVSAEPYSKVPEGTAVIHQCPSGDMLTALEFLPSGTGPEVLGYWFPPDGKGITESDCFCVLAGAEHPVLAHLFMDFMLDPANARQNFEFVGYQQPLTAITADELIASGAVPESLRNTVIREDDLVNGYRRVGLSVDGDAAWQQVWSGFNAGS